MNKKNDILKTIQELHLEIEKNVSPEKMSNDVRMMNFKIRPLSGDVNLLTSLNNKGFIEILWKIGKLDEFYIREVKKFNLKEKEILKNFFVSLHDKFQQQLNKLNFSLEKTKAKPAFFEMEIIKEIKNRKSN